MLHFLFLNFIFGFKVADLVVNLQIRDQKRAAVLKEKRELSGSRSPPRVIVSKTLHSVQLNCMFICWMLSLNLIFLFL